MVRAFGYVVAAGFAALALVACSPGGPVLGDEKKSAEWVKKELLAAETQGGATGEMFAALRAAEPEIYAKFVDAATRKVAAGQTTQEAGFAAGAEVRPLYLERFIALSRTAADADINELLDYSGDQMQALMAIDPKLCVTVAMGGTDPRVQQLPQAMLEREMRVMARMIRAGQQSGAGAAPDELNAWIEKFAAEYPAAIEGLTMMDTPAPDTAQATTICQSNIAMTEALAKEEPATRARLFRALLQS